MLEKGNESNQKKENIPIRKRKLFQLEEGEYSDQKKENIPIRKWKISQLVKRKYFQFELGN